DAPHLVAVPLGYDAAGRRILPAHVAEGQHGMVGRVEEVPEAHLQEARIPFVVVRGPGPEFSPPLLEEEAEVGVAADVPRLPEIADARIAGHELAHYLPGGRALRGVVGHDDVQVP